MPATAENIQAEPTPLAAEALARDPRVAEARALLRAALDDATASIDGVRGPDPARAAAYGARLTQYAADRGGALWYPYLGSGVGRGPFVELADGSVKYDMTNGIGVHVMGHSHPDLLDTGIDAALGDVVMHGALQQNEDSATLSRKLIDLARASGAPLSHVYLTTSGAMANENSFKMAFQKRALEGHPADRMLAFQGTFCGRTLALSSMSDKPGNRVGLPKAMDVDYVPFFDEGDPAGSTRRAVDRLHEHLTRWPGHHAGFKMELIIGEGGFYAGTHDFFMALIEPLKAAGVAVICDEIQSFSRTSRPFAFQHFGLDSHVDLVNIGKSTQLCATLFSDAWAPRPGLIAQTFTGSTSSIRAAHHILDLMRDGGWYTAPGNDPADDIGTVMRVSERLRNGLRDLAADHPDRVSGPFGLGSMIAFTPFDGTLDTAKSILDDLYAHGVVAFVCGREHARIRFLPACAVLEDHHIDDVLGILRGALDRHAGILA